MCSSPEADWVVRGGVATAQQLANGARQVADHSGWCEISAAHQPGRTVAELAALARFPNAHISVATRDALLAAGALAVRETPGRNPVHADIIVPCTSEGVVDHGVLEALAAAFVQRPNPARSIPR